jgi:hypothetical protein
MLPLGGNMFEPTRPRLLTPEEMTPEEIISLQQQGIDPYATPEERERKARKGFKKSAEIYRQKVDGLPSRWT